MTKNVRKPSTTIEIQLSTLGGTLGGMMGMSFISFIEVAYWFVGGIFFVFSKKIIDQKDDDDDKKKIIDQKDDNKEKVIDDDVLSSSRDEEEGIAWWLDASCVMSSKDEMDERILEV